MSKILIVGAGQAGLRLDDIRREQRCCLCLIQFDPGVEHVRLGFVQGGLPSGQVGEKLVRSPDKRPFWASAGPDGAFTDPNPSQKKPVGEDNVSSFED